MIESSTIDRKCALCLQVRKLCRSHIILDFLYSDVYDESGKKIIVRSAIDSQDKFRQSGFWERLLCTDCENLLGELDRYAASVLKGKVELEGRQEGAVIHLSGFEYAK